MKILIVIFFSKEKRAKLTTLPTNKVLIKALFFLIRCIISFTFDVSISATDQKGRNKHRNITVVHKIEKIIDCIGREKSLRQETGEKKAI